MTDPSRRSADVSILDAVPAIMSGVQNKSRFVNPENLPPKPIYVLRGHIAEITSLRFLRNNTRLVSG